MPLLVFLTRMRASIYSTQFILLCLSSFLFSASFNMLIPDLPDYLSSLGGAEYKGLIIALFTLTAGISRPFSGKLTDTIGRVPIMAIGSIVCFLCGLLYPVLTSVSGFLFIRLIHGFSTGFKPTATAAYIADVIPKNRWGEAMGIHGISFSTGMAVGPAMGSAVTQYYSIDVLFYLSSLLALLSILIIMNVRETLNSRQTFQWSLLRISRRDIIDVQVLPAGIVTFLSYMPYGILLTLIPDWSAHLGFQNKGLFFMVFTVFSLLVRFFAGRVSDQYGRVKVSLAGLTLLLLALSVLAMSSTGWGLWISGALYGVATGILSPAVNAWTVELSTPAHRGKAMATMYIALEAGIGIGALISGWIYQDALSRVPMIFYGSVFTTALALAYLLYWKTKNQRQGKPLAEELVE